MFDTSFFKPFKGRLKLQFSDGLCCFLGFTSLGRLVFDDVYGVMGSGVAAGLGAHHIDLHFIFARLGGDTVKFIALGRAVKYGFIAFGCHTLK